MNPNEPAARVLLHIGDAEAWLRRARREWRRGARVRTLLALSLAEAEVRIVRREAASAPLPARASSPAVRMALTAACAALVAILGAGVWSGVRWDEQARTTRAIARPAEARTLSLGYVPGVVLRLVAPAREELSSAPRPVQTGDEQSVPAVLLVGTGGWMFERAWPPDTLSPWWPLDQATTDSP